MPPENEQANAPKPAGKKLPVKSMMIILVIMLLEGGLLAFWMATVKPESAVGALAGDEAGPPAEATGEALIVEDRVSNMRSGRLYLYDIKICIEVDSKDIEAVKKQLDKRDAYVRDNIRTVFAQADPQYLEEPELQTMKRKIHEILEEVLGEESVKRVMFAKYIRYLGQ